MNFFPIQFENFSLENLRTFHSLLILFLEQTHDKKNNIAKKVFVLISK
jgi:hypothetical protein